MLAPTLPAATATATATAHLALSVRRRRRPPPRLVLAPGVSSHAALPSHVAYDGEDAALALAARAYESGPVEVCPRVFLADERRAHDPHVWERHGITLVLTVALECRFPPWRLATGRDPPSAHPKGIDAVHLPWSHGQADLATSAETGFPRICQLVSSHLSKQAGAVLVHCQCGVSRSATAVVAYLMYASDMSMHDAYMRVKRLSPAISPNCTLLAQLAEWEHHLRLVREPKPSADPHSHPALPVRTNLLDPPMTGCKRSFSPLPIGAGRDLSPPSTPLKKTRTLHPPPPPAPRRSPPSHIFLD